MSEKTDKKRALLLDGAYDVFVKKGYRDVTMKDIAEASEVSRGGLYLYFSTVEDVFLAVLEREEKREDSQVEQEQLQEATNVEMLLWFLKLQKKQMLGKNAGLLMAKYEYAFACREFSGAEHIGKTAGKIPSLKKERRKALLVLEKILDRGMESGEFACLDAAHEAENIMLVIDGMKILACTKGITEKKIDNEFLYMMQRIVIEA